MSNETTFKYADRLFFFFKRESRVGTFAFCDTGEFPKCSESSRRLKTHDAHTHIHPAPISHIKMAEVSLYDSAICRLCAEDNGNGELLYVADNDEQDLSSMVNRYLPIKVCNLTTTTYITSDPNLTSYRTAIWRLYWFSLHTHPN